MRLSRLLAALAAGSLLLNPSGPAAGDPPTPPTVRPAAPQGTRITLITGDQVQVRTGRVTFLPARGSASTGAFTSQVGGHTLVIPAAVRGAVAAGTLDRSLFDITTLLAERYDDTHSAVLPVIIRYAGDRTTAGGRATQDRPAGAARTRVLTSIGARSVAITKSSARAFWSSATVDGSRVESGVRQIVLDRRVRAVTDRSVPQIGAPAAWQRGFTGRGVKVAVLDTGIDTGHPDLAGKVAESADFSGTGDPVDHFGHGTHVAGIIAGNGAASDGKYRGVAPDATLLNGKVLDDGGSGSFSGIIAGMEWATAHGAKVVNMSLGASNPFGGPDVVSAALDALSEQTGALFVVAAGNCFDTGPEQVSSPAVADSALAVANLQRDGSVNETSCRGPRKGDGALKPEIAAPGTGIVAARAAGTDLGDPVGDSYTTLSGTSMATPHVAGTAALLAQSQPGWTGDQLRNRLISTADPQGADPVTAQGAGRVDADQATDGGITVDAGELELGYLKWPHPNQQPITRTMTYRNSSATAVTLDLTATGTTPAPAFSTPRLVVPAGGQATVDVTVDPAAGSFGSHGGRILATPAAGGDPLVTTFGWYFEDERISLTINGINHDGSPANDTVLIGRPDGKPLTGLDPRGTPLIDGHATVRVPPGILDVSAYFWLPATDHAPAALTQVEAPQVNASADTTVTLDARKAKPADLSASGRPDLTSRYRVMRHYRTTFDGAPAAANSAWITARDVRYFATPTDQVTVGDVEYRTGGRLEVPPYNVRSLGDGGGGVPAADIDWGPRLDGVHHLVAVDAGTGSPEDLAGDRVRGKLALIRHDPFADWADDVLKAAQQAGAAAVMLYNPDLPGIDGADSQISGEGVTVPTLRTSRTGAAALLALMKQRTVTVRVTGVRWTPVVYDLLAPTRGRVPADPGHRARPSGLARIDETFGAQVQGAPLIEDRTPLGTFEPPFLSSPVDVVPILPGPARRTSYVSAGPIRWDQHVLPFFDGTASGWSLTPTRSYGAGTRSRIEWTMPVANSGIPAAPNTIAGVRRTEGWLSVCFNPVDNGRDHEALLDGATSVLSIRRDGELVGSIDDRCAFAETPADAADYEVTLDTGIEGSWRKYSTKARSTWRFHAAGGDDEVMPVILADLRLPGANLLNQVRTGTPTTVELALRHQHGGQAPAFTSAQLEISYDGTTWTKLPLAPAGADRYTARVTHPAAQAGRSPSLRLHVTDAAGGELNQEVTSAYGLVR